MKNRTQIKKTTGMLLAAALMLLLPGLTLAEEYVSFAAYGVDTIAGYSTILRTSKTYPGQDVNFKVKKPDGGLVSIVSKTDITGVARADLYDFHTRRAGKYTVSAEIPAQKLVSSQSSFNVYADEVSVDQSSVVAQSNVAKADGTDKVYVTVNLRDSYGNPFPGHLINLISSRSSDSISKPTELPTTDLNGTIVFTVSSGEPGVSVFSAVDATSGTVLNSRTNVAFISGNSIMQDAGGNFPLVKYAAAAPAGPIHHFEISDLPPSIKPNDNISFRVTAKDSNSLTVENYTGTIHFSAEGSNSQNVTLPEDYTFKAEDMGTHLFSLGLKFTVAGNYKIVVTDMSNQLLKGEKAVVAGSSSGTGSTDSQSATKPVILMPTSGTFSQNQQTISGNAQAGSTIKIKDNGQEIGTVQANQSGTFSFQANQLADGKHSFEVVLLDLSQTVIATSDAVEITIDTTPPKVDQVDLDPKSDIKADSVVTVNVISEENLSQAALIFNNDIVQLSPSLDQPGNYVGSIKAPADPGAYPVDILLVDQLGNEATYQAQATLNITEAGGSATVENAMTQEETQETTQEQTQEVNMAPSQVFGVIAYGSDKRATLVWEAATDDGVIKNYKVYYGLDPANLDNSVETWDASTTWYIPNLSNGEEYYFAVSAVDDLGIESVLVSDTVSAIPFSLEGNNIEKPTEALGEGENVRPAALEDYVPPEMAKNGPELLLLLFGSGILGGISSKLSRKKKISK